MKIIYLLNTTSPNAGSTKSFMLLVRRVVEIHDVMVIAPEEGGVVADLRAMGVTVHVLHYIFNMRPYTTTMRDKLIFPLRFVRLRVLNYLASRKLDIIARNFGADLFHSNTSVTEIGWMSARRLGIPHLSHVREYGRKDHQIHIYGLQKRLHGPDSYTICITRDISDYHGLTGSSRSFVIYNPLINDDQIRKIWPKGNYILYAGRINETKGIDDLIDSYIQYAGELGGKMPLYLAGSYAGPRYEAIVERCNARLEKVGLRHMVHWLGARRDIRDLMGNARVVVVPSLFEGFGRVMPEAMANGTLVAARDTGGSHEQFENGIMASGGEIGLRFNDVEDMAYSMKRAEDMDQDEYDGFVERAFVAIRHFYLSDNSVAKVLKVYERIYGEHSR